MGRNRQEVQFSEHTIIVAKPADTEYCRFIAVKQQHVDGL